jgi:hypothetical protein
MMRATVLVACLVCIQGLANAGWQEPENLGPPINTQYDEWYPVVARDESFMIFSSTRLGGHGETDLWISYRDGDQWQTPTNLGSNVNTSATESAPYLARNDSVLYFTSSASGGHGGLDIWWCPMADGVPGPKVNMGSSINGSAHDCCPVLSHDGNSFYICSDRNGGFGSLDGWCFTREGEDWGAAQNMGGNVNSGQSDCPRWLSDDDSTMILCSTSLAGYGGADIYYTTREADGWATVRNMGSTINSSDYELGVGFTGNSGTIGGAMYFGSGRSGGYGGWDIWCSTETQLEAPGGGLVPGFSLRAFPNPVTSGTTIAYTLARPAHVLIRLYDLHGRLVKALLDESRSPGDHTATWDGMTDSGAHAPEGVCFCRMQAGNICSSTKLVVTRN